MHLIAPRKLQEAAAQYPDTKIWVKNFCKTIKLATWQNLIEVQELFSSAEAVGEFTVLNVKGNSYRLILSIDYEAQVAYFKYFLTHADYDKESWKDDPYY
jgi:mRNA interferase HigB